MSKDNDYGKDYDPFWNEENMLNCWDEDSAELKAVKMELEELKKKMKRLHLIKDIRRNMDIANGLLFLCFDRKWKNNEKLRIERALHAALDIIYDYDYIFVEGVEEEEEQENEAENKNNNNKEAIQTPSPSKSSTMTFDDE